MRLTPLLVAAAVAALVAPRAQAQSAQWQNSGNGSWRQYQYIDFASSTIAGHVTFNTFTFTPGAPNVKYTALQIDNPGAVSSQCFEIATGNPFTHPNNSADTRIWIQDSTGGYRSLNDDSGGTLYSRGRLFLRTQTSPAFLNTYVSAFSSVHNTEHFGLFLSRLNLSEAACTTGQALPWVKNIDNTLTFSANAN